MAKDNKHDPNDPSIRGGSRRHEMQEKNTKYYKGAKGRPYRYKRLLEQEEAASQAELEEVKAEVEKAAKEAAEKTTPKKKAKSKKSKRSEKNAD